MKYPLSLSRVLFPFVLAGVGILLFLKMLSVNHVYALTCNVPTGTHPSIQSAIGDSVCDVINLTASAYLENVLITRSVTIQGQGALSTTIDGGAIDRVFTIQSGLEVTLTHIAIMNGYAPVGDSDRGAGIYVDGSTLTVQYSHIFSNVALSGAGIFSDNSVTTILTSTFQHNGALVNGGAIANLGGSMTIKNSQFISNTADQFRGGGIWNYGTMILDKSDLIGNSTQWGNGGGIHNDNPGVLTVTNSTLEGNIIVFGSGAGIFNAGLLNVHNSVINQNFGSGIRNFGELIIENSVISGNSGEFAGNGIHNSGFLNVNNSIFDGNGGESNIAHGLTSELATINNSIIRNSLGRGFENNGNLILDNVLLENNTGGGIHNSGALTLTSGVFISNSSLAGGGFLNSGSALIEESLFEQNSAVEEGGGIFNRSGGTLKLVNSTLYNNSANSGGGVANDLGKVYIIGSTFDRNNAASEGGGIYNFQNDMWPGVVVITNTTLFSNTANIGGGIANKYNQFTSINSTIANNSATNGGGIHNLNGSLGFLQLANTIVANSLNGDECSGDVPISLGHNIASDGSCNLASTGDMPNTDPLIGPLQDNGGSTWTNALPVSSPAIDAGDNANCPETDQRGMIRPFDGDGDTLTICDIGSYEYGTLSAVSDAVTTTQNTAVLVDVLANDLPNGQLILQSVGMPMTGTTAVSGTQVLYTPAMGFIGQDTFFYIVTNGVLTDTAFVSVTVTPLDVDHLLFLPVILKPEG